MLLQDVLSDAKALEDYWRSRDTQIKIDRDWINLVKPVETSDKIRWTSNEPKVFFETAKALLSSYQPRFRVPLTINYTPDEKQRINKTERFLMGIFRALDHSQMSRGRNYWLRDLAHWVLSGWYAVFVKVQKIDSDVIFTADIWEPNTVYPRWDSFGLQTLVRSYEIDKNTALSMIEEWQAKGAQIDFQKPGDEVATVKVINYWRRDIASNGGKITKNVYNCIIIGGQVVKDWTKEDGNHIPVLVGTVGVPEKSSLDWQTRVGESIIAANRDMYEYDNKTISLMATILSETAYPNIVTKSLSGAPILDGNQLKGYGDTISLRVGEQIELLKHASTPNEVNFLMQWVANRKQKGSIPDIVYGGVPVELSGFAISQLMAAIKYKLAPYLNTMQYVISAVGTELLEQYKAGSFPKVKLHTNNPHEMRKGIFFVEEFSKEDVPETTYIDVTIPITSSMDKTQQIIFARQALSPPQIMSRETLWDEVLDIQDTEQEYARILQDETLELPIVKQIGVIEQLRVRMEGFKAQGKVAEAKALNNYIMALEMQLGMRQGIPQTPGAGGIPPQVQPPEMMGAESPDQQRGALGMPPPGLARRPQTSEERAQSKTTGATLVSPTGETLIR